MRSEITNRKTESAPRLLSIGFALAIFVGGCAVASAQKTKDFDGHIKPEHRALIKAEIGGDKNLRPAAIADYQKDFGLDESLRASEGKSAHPYYATRDFNQDKIADFAVVLINPRGTAGQNFTLLVFNGDRAGKYKLTLRINRLNLATGGIGSDQNMGGAKSALAIGEYETDDCTYFVWQKGKYVGRDCSEGEQ